MDRNGCFVFGEGADHVTHIQPTVEEVKKLLKTLGNSAQM